MYQKIDQNIPKVWPEQKYRLFQDPCSSTPPASQRTAGSPVKVFVWNWIQRFLFCMGSGTYSLFLQVNRECTVDVSNGFTIIQSHKTHKAFESLIISCTFPYMTAENRHFHKDNLAPVFYDIPCTFYRLTTLNSGMTSVSLRLSSAALSLSNFLLLDTAVVTQVLGLRMVIPDRSVTATTQKQAIKKQYTVYTHHFSRLHNSHTCKRFSSSH